MIPLYFQDVLRILCKDCAREMKIHSAGEKGIVYAKCQHCAERVASEGGGDE